MVHDTLQKLETILKGAKRLPDAKRENLLSLVDELKSELDDLGKTRQDDATLLALLTKLVTFQKLQTPNHTAVSTHTDNSLSTALTEFETSHPKLVETIQSICISLSNLGI